MARKTVTFSINESDVKNLKRKLARIGPGVFKQLEPIVEEAAEVLVDEARARAPVDQGDLRASIHASAAFSKQNTVVFDVGPDKEHGFKGKFSEFGTRKQPKKPWLRPASDAVEDEVGNMLAAGVLRIIEQEDK